MNIVPLSAVPSQTVFVVLGGQNCRLALYQKSTGMYADLFVDDNPIFTCVSCQDRNLLKREKYLPFDGDLVFFDLQGVNDPDYLGIGTRFFLGYLSVDDLGGVA